MNTLAETTDKPVLIFFDGEEIEFPAQNEWEKFVGVDSARLFWTAAEQWRSLDFTPIRLTTLQVFGNTFVDRIKFTGRIPESYHWYPESRWQFWAKARAWMANERYDNGELCLFSTVDVIPVLSPEFPDMHFPLPRCVTFQRDHFSLSLFAANRAWIKAAIFLLESYDLGDLPRIAHSYVSDESILRHYVDHFPAFSTTNAGTQVFPLGDFREVSPAPGQIHLSRSSMARAYRSIPVF